MEGTGASHSGKWLSVVGWGVEWGVEWEDSPSPLCPVFRAANILDPWHWGLYERHTSAEAVENLRVCALVEVVCVAGKYVSTGRVRWHANLEKEGYMRWACRDERNNWIRANRIRKSLLRGRALNLLAELEKSQWFEAAAPGSQLSDIRALIADCRSTGVL